MKRIALFAVGVILGLSAVTIGHSSIAKAVSSVGQPIGYSSADVVNPLRGQFENLGEGLFPQANNNQSAHPSWPGTVDANGRLDWSTVQPVDPRTLPSNATDAQKYDFSAIDQFITQRASEGKRTGFRLTSFNSCCETSYPGNLNMSVPAWLRTVSGATSDYSFGGNTHVIPNWNNNEYLTYTEDLIAALGRRYNKDERVSMYEFSGYGDFSENHNAFMRDDLGIPGPSPANSVAQLGYYSQYGDQYITKASIVRLVDATLEAFPDTQIVTSPANPEIVKQFYRDSTKLTSSMKPVGNRSDCIGTYSSHPTWAENQFSYYVQNNDPILSVLVDRSKTAPTIIEWCNFQTGTNQEYYEKALTDVVNQNISMLASTGFPHQFAASTMPNGLYDLWSRANKFSGYRYSIDSATLQDTAAAGANVPLSVQWSNKGSAPTYEDWQVQYEVVDSANTVVKTVNSSLNLKTLSAAQNYTNVANEPATQAVQDTTAIDTAGLAAGNYTVRAKVSWNEHKLAGINTVAFAPMNLATQGRDGTGAYSIGSFSVTPAQSADGGSPETSSTGSANTSNTNGSIGAPNTGAGAEPVRVSILFILAAIVVSCAFAIKKLKLLK